eukprot:m.37522 g.37522  ORF g.37522 m.37522 type:complete len:84 (-) comp7710_c0_seq2:1145-1396(-)
MAVSCSGLRLFDIFKFPYIAFNAVLNSRMLCCTQNVKVRLANTVLSFTQKMLSWFRTTQAGVPWGLVEDCSCRGCVVSVCLAS